MTTDETIHAKLCELEHKVDMAIEMLSMNRSQNDRSPLRNRLNGILRQLAVAKQDADRHDTV